MRKLIIGVIAVLGMLAFSGCGSSGGSSSGGDAPPVAQKINIADYMYKGATLQFTVNGISQNWSNNGIGAFVKVGDRDIQFRMPTGLFSIADSYVKASDGLMMRFPDIVTEGQEYSAKYAEYIKMQAYIEGDTLKLVVVAYDFEEVISYTEYHFSNRNGLHTII